MDNERPIRTTAVKRTASLAMQKYPLILVLHEADMEATYLIEKREE